ncbi:hypothetical protein GCM10023189_24410 [Nibrella saemangeumensis]|uniref:DUF3575 domain-containing protein n=2 Tax=Nibrella saemangeumensis TaxID=1084526 RepID=A0ABP8MW09_9BACT
MLTGLAMLCSTAFALAQSVLKANLISPFFRTANVSFEKVIKQDRSLQVGFYYTGLRYKNTRFNGYGVTPEYRMYLSVDRKDAPQGFYLAPFLRYQQFSLTQVDTRVGGSLTTYGGGVTAGYQALFSDRITLDAFLGPSYNNGRVRADAGLVQSPFAISIFTGFLVRGGLNIGIKL